MSQSVETDHDLIMHAPLVRPQFLAPDGPELQPGRAGASAGLLKSARYAFEQRQVFVLIPFAIILGLVASLATSAAPNPLALSIVGAMLAVGVVAAWRALAILRALALASAFWLGFALFGIYGALLGTPMLYGSAYGTYQMRVDQVISADETGRRVVVSQIVPVASAHALGVRRARLLIKNGPDLAPGDIIEGPIRFYGVPGPVLPGSFDSQFHAYFTGIGAYGSATQTVKLLQPGDPNAPMRQIDRLRRNIGGRIDAALSEPSSGIARALITGDQTGISDTARKTMASAGLAHVLSISGLHLTLVAGSVFVVMRLIFSLIGGLSQWVSAKKLAAGGGIVAALVYFAISGSNVAALRSTIMLVLVFSAVLFGRRALTMRNVAIAALICIFLNPANVFRPSFQLSFSAVIGLIGVYELIGRRLPVRGGWARQTAGYMLGIATTSVIAGGATTLFSIYHFQQTSPLGLLANLAALPLVGFIMMPCALISVMMMPFGAEQPFLRVMGWSIERMLDVAGVVAGWSENFNASPLLTPLALFIGLLALGWFCFFTNRYRLIGPALVIPAILVFAVDRRPDVVVADTTQALAIRSDTGFILAAGKEGSFAVRVWQETFHVPIGKPGPALTQCDTLGCVSTSPLGFTIAVTKNAAGFAEDCRSADLVVTRLFAPGYCRAETAVIDANDLRRGGVHTAFWNETQKSFTVRAAITDPNRAWRAVP